MRQPVAGAQEQDASVKNGGLHRPTVAQQANHLAAGRQGQAHDKQEQEGKPGQPLIANQHPDRQKHEDGPHPQPGLQHRVSLAGCLFRLFLEAAKAAFAPAEITQRFLQNAGIEIRPALGSNPELGVSYLPK